MIEKSKFIFNEENKIHINLSDLAHDTMMSDMAAFKIENRSAYINRLCECYAKKSRSSITERLNEREEYLNQILKNFQDEQKQDMISALLNDYEKKLFAEACEYPKSIGFKIRVRNDVVDLLDDLDVAKYEFKGMHKYEGSAGPFIKSVCEEFTRLPFIKREELFYQDIIDTINDAIARKKTLKIKQQNNTYYVLPYAVMHDNMNLYNYLVGYSYSTNSVKDAIKVCSFRISKIASARVMESKSAVLTAKQKNEIKTKIQQKGIQFLIADSSTIKVKLTPAGIKMYNSQLHLRPKYVAVDGDVYTFNCTTTQAEYYFFKFASNAKILEPQLLANKFKRMYANASEQY